MGYNTGIFLNGKSIGMGRSPVPNAKGFAEMEEKGLYNSH